MRVKTKKGFGAALGLINLLVGCRVKDPCRSSNHDFLLKNILREEGLRSSGCVSIENSSVRVNISIKLKQKCISSCFGRCFSK